MAVSLHAPPRIAVVGPESSGKTTLAAELARTLGGVWVPEYAREYLESRGGGYVESDLEAIARGQLERENERVAHAPPAVICDTNLLVVKIWGEVKYGRCPPWVRAHYEPESYALHLLTAPDLGWTPDPLREAPEEAVRWKLMARYQRALEEAAVPFHIVEGTGDKRTESALAAVREVLK